MGVPGRTNRTQDLQPILLYIIRSSFRRPMGHPV